MIIYQRWSNRYMFCLAQWKVNDILPYFITTCFFLVPFPISWQLTKIGNRQYKVAKNGGTIISRNNLHTVINVTLKYNSIWCYYTTLGFATKCFWYLDIQSYINQRPTVRSKATNDRLSFTPHVRLTHKIMCIALPVPCVISLLFHLH
jgi:hypothetical protein